MKHILSLHDVTLADVERVGGKNASTGEMLRNLVNQGIKVPEGFATTAEAYREFLETNELDEKIAAILSKINVNKPKALDKASAQIRKLITTASFQRDFENEIRHAYKEFKNKSVAIRSSATAEDLEDASFAGQQDTFLNVKGITNILHAIKQVFASLFTSRAIAYREHHGFEHMEVAISVGCQPMIRSDKGASGVMFTIDTESGFDKVILVTGTYGLGETVVQGAVTPDEFILYKPGIEGGRSPVLQRKLGDKKVKMIFNTAKSTRKYVKTIATSEKERTNFCLTDDELVTLGKQALLIESHYKKPMDIEWAKDGITGEIYIVQARPETVKSRSDKQVIENFRLLDKGELITTGQAIGQQIGQGKARLIKSAKNVNALTAGEVLVTDMTDPDWEPIMKKASAIVTNRGGRTCHAAIVARELGIPAVIGCGDATKKIKEKQQITVSCAEGNTGYIYNGILEYDVQRTAINSLPELPVKICMNMANPDKAFTNQFLPNHGVGLARLEFIISIMIGIHPNACLEYDILPAALKNQIKKKTAGYADPTEYYIERLREGISTIAAAFYPKPVIFRFSDFKSNEYANLLGGDLYEPNEENPMLGFRGASRYVDDTFFEAFQMECEAFLRVREDMGLTNAHVMVPFVRTPDELKDVIDLAAQYGLKRGDDGLQMYMMCEIPSNAVLADDFLKYVDGFSIGSNDLTQLTLGLDRDSSQVAHTFDERNMAVKILLGLAIDACNKAGKYIGICGQGPSDHPDLAEWLMQQGIQAMSLNPDSIISTWLELGRIHRKSQLQVIG